MDLRVLLMVSRFVPILVGPTASGKTTVGILLAELLGGEIISADSRQVYKYIDLGTAKPSRVERRRVKHHFVDDLRPEEYFSAGEFGRQGRKRIEEIFRRRRQPVVVGGSGLYVQSLVDGLFETPAHDKDLRDQLSKRLHDEGSESLLTELAQLDPVSATKMLPSNTRRIVRALEVYYLTGIPLSKHHEEQRFERTFRPVFVGLGWDRRKLYERIDARVEGMVERGLLDEVRDLRRRGYRSSLNALQTVGYLEVFQHLNGTISKERMIELIKQNSRRYAKRQLTWFRRDRRIRWFAVHDDEEFLVVAKKITKHFREQQRST